jgi:hypothetical protein
MYWTLGGAGFPFGSENDPGATLSILGGVRAGFGAPVLAALATLAVGGAILTLGLIQRWGEVFPRWIPFVGGKRVPISLAVVPAGSGLGDDGGTDVCPPDAHRQARCDTWRGSIERAELGGMTSIARNGIKLSLAP